MVSKFGGAPHVAIDFGISEVGVLLLDGVVGEMVFPAVAFGVIFLYAESNVRLFIAPNCQRIPVSNQNPLSDIEFPIFNNQWVLDAFLHDPESGVSFQKFDSVQDFFICFINLNSTASRA